jgi:hypothetical protein
MVQDFLHLIRLVQSANEVDLADAMLCIIVHAAFCEGVPIRACDLGHQMGMPQQTISRRVQRLVNRGLVMSFPLTGRSRTLQPGFGMDIGTSLLGSRPQQHMTS